MEEDLRGAYRNMHQSQVVDGRLIVIHHGEEHRCDNCPWTRRCIEPPASFESVASKIDDTIKSSEKDPTLGAVLGSMIFGPDATRSRVCPILAERLRATPDVSGAVRAIMMDWRD